MYMWNQVNYNQSHYANVGTSAPYNHCSYPKVPCPHQVAPSDALSSVVACVLEGADLSSLLLLPYQPLCSIPLCPWRLDQRPDYLFLASEAIVYVVPRTRACRPDRPSKTIFPKMCLRT